MQALIDATTPMVGCEGFVVRFDDGHMIKVKAEDYLLKHKTKDAMSFEKNVVEILVREKADDMKAFMDEADLARFNEFEEAFWTGVKKTAYDLSLLRHSDQSPDRKSYAVGFVQKQKPEYAKFLYRMFEYMSDAEVFEMVKDAILSSCGTQTKINDARWMFGDAHWNESVRIEE
jgi:RNA ligase